MTFYWWDFLIILYNIFISYRFYKKDINPKTAKEWDGWSNGIYTNTRCHYSERRAYSSGMIVFHWTIGWWFIRACVLYFIS